MFLSSKLTVKLTVLLAAVAAVASLTTGPASAEGAQQVKTRIHFVEGGGHNWRGHFPILQEILRKTGDFEVTSSGDLGELRSENISKYDVVLFYGSNQNFDEDEKEAQEKGLCDFVREGGGFAGIHSASDSFKKSDAYWELVGGRFAGHGGGKFKVYIHDETHPITFGLVGLKEFDITDETYSHKYHKNACMRSLVRMNRGEGPRAERQSMGWVQDYGKGRVFYTSLGHGKGAWTNPHFQRLAVRGIYWSAGREPKDPLVDGAPATSGGRAAIRLPLPRPGSVGLPEAVPLLLSIRQGGRWLIGDTVVDGDRILRRLREAKKSDPNLAVILRAEPTVPYEDVLRVMETCRKAGVKNVSVAVDPEEECQGCGM